MSSAQFSIYIPRIFTNISNSKIVSTFEHLQLGKVQYMDIVYRTGNDGSTYKMAFIHFSYWSNNSSAIELRERIEDPYIEAKLVYDDPWYWIILPNKSSVSRQYKRDSQFDLNDYVNRISSITEKLNAVYNKMFMKHSHNHSLVRDYSIDIESGDFTRMSMSELDIPLHYTPYAKIHSSNSSNSSNPNYDEQMSVCSDGFDDLELGGAPDSHAILISDKDNYLKKWVTENICGNA